MGLIDEQVAHMLGDPRLELHGLVPQSRPAGHADSCTDFTPDPPAGIRDLLRRVRAAVADAGKQGRPWSDVLESLRLQNGAL